MKTKTQRVNPKAFLVVVGLAASAAGANDRYFVGGDSGWNVAANWNPNGIPTAMDNVFIRGGQTCHLNSDAAFAASLQLGGNLAGTLQHSGQVLTVGGYTEVGGDGAGGVGTYNIWDTGQLITHRLMVGRHAVSTLNFDGRLAMRVDNDAYVGGHVRGNFNQSVGTVVVMRDLVLGLYNGGDGRWSLTGGVTEVRRDAYIGYDLDGRGRLEVNAGANFGVGGRMYIGQFGATPGVHGEVVMNGGRLYGAGGTGRVVVQGSKGRLTGQGLFDVEVQYQSDKLFANAESLRVTFDRDVMTRGGVMNVTPGLSARSGGTAEIRGALENRSLPSTSAAVVWGNGSAGQSVNYKNVLNHPPASNPIAISMPYQRTDITNTFNDPLAGGAVSRDNLAARIRLLQNGQRRFAPGSDTPVASSEGQVRNVTESIGAERVVGKVQDVWREFDTTIIGNPVKPQHQNPLFRRVHARGLTGNGVRIGQIEPGTPYAAHGAFEDWTTANGRRITIVNTAATTNDFHATAVASVIAGYDPFGLPVDGQSRLEPAARRYGAAGSDGMGFVGAAPRAVLFSRAQDNDPAGTDDDRFINNLRRLVTTDNSKIVNMSASILANTIVENERGGRKGELAIDYFAQNNGLVMVSAAGNLGVLGYRSLVTGTAAYNSIVVANAEFNDRDYPSDFRHTAATIANTSSRGPTSDGRAKPDIAAHGRGVLMAFQMTQLDANNRRIHDALFPHEGDRGLYSTQFRQNDTTSTFTSGTSFAAPQVAGAAALMVEQAGITFTAAAERARATSPLTIKSVLQTSADKPPSWQRGRAGNAGDATNTQIPLSYDWGAGLLSPEGAIDLIQRGNFAHAASPIFGQGWAQHDLTRDANDGVGGRNGHIYLLKDVKASSSLTATLNWFREMNAPADGAPDPNNYTVRQFFNLDLELFSWDGAVLNRIAISNSTVDNVEHIWLTMPDVNSDYYLRVFHNGMPIGGLTPYALSWTYTLVPSPGGLFALVAVGLVAYRRRRA